MSEYTEYFLGDICGRLSSGNSIKASDVCEKGMYPVFGGNGVRGYASNFNFSGDCAIIGRQGAYCGNVRYFSGKAYMTEHAIVAYANDNHDSHYLAYLLSLMNLGRLSGQSAQPGLSVETLSKQKLLLPPLDIQKKVSKVLGELDAKIEVNNDIIFELEQMVKTLYNYWFLQFDFPDKNGDPYRQSGGKMVYNKELNRDIPEGWEVKTFADLIGHSKNGDWGTEGASSENDIKVNCFRGADFASITTSYQINAPERFIRSSNSDRLLADGDLVVEISGGSPTQSTGRIGYVNQAFLNRNSNPMNCSNFCKAFTPTKRIYQFWLYQTWKNYYEANIMFNYESKTTGIKNLMFDDFISSIKIVAPTDEIFELYQKMSSVFYDKIQKCLMESSQLASLRDFLLPMLMNGQAEVV